MATWEYACSECDWRFTTSDPEIKERLDRGRIRHSSVQYLHGRSGSCMGWMQRVWSTFEFRIKGKDKL